MTALSVVVANVLDQVSEVESALDALERELADGDQIVLVDAAGTAPQRPGVTYVRASPPPSRGGLYAAGLAASTHDLVAFSDSSTEPQPGWRRAAVAALVAGAGVVGGPVMPGHDRTLRTVAGFLVEYGPHAVAPFTNASGDVAANNVAYHRAVLDPVLGPGEPLWKNVVNGRLRARGSPPVLVPAMRVTSTKTYGWRDIVTGRAAHGRLYGAQRSASWTRARRVTAALACAGLPLVGHLRLVARTSGEQRLRTDLVRATPLVVLALLMWSVGEALGYLLGPGSAGDVF